MSRSPYRENRAKTGLDTRTAASMASPHLTCANTGVSYTEQARVHKGRQESHSLSSMISRETGVASWRHRQTIKGESLQDLVSEGMFFMPTYDQLYSPKYAPRLETITESNNAKRTRIIQQRISTNDNIFTELRAYSQPSTSHPESRGWKAKGPYVDPRRKKEPIHSGEPLSSFPVTPTDVAEWASIKKVSGKPHARSSSTSNVHKVVPVCRPYMQPQANRSAPLLAKMKLEKIAPVQSPLANPFEFDQTTMSGWEALTGAGNHARARRIDGRDSTTLMTEEKSATPMQAKAESPLAGRSHASEQAQEEADAAQPEAKMMESTLVDELETIEIGEAECSEPVQGLLDGETLVSRVIKAF